MSLVLLLIGLVVALMLISSVPKLPSPAAKGGAIAGALAALFVFTLLSSVRFVGADQVGVVEKNIGARSLPQGEIIATRGEKGPQARVLPPGWHPWLWPGIYTVKTEQIIQVGEAEVGLVTAMDGRPLPPGQAFAPELDDDEFIRLINDANAFLADAGYKGPQTNVLRPGSYRINPRLFKVEMAAVTDIPKARVGVVKSNVGADSVDPAAARVVPRGSKGIWDTPFQPSRQYLNTRAFEITLISTDMRTIRYTKGARNTGEGEEEREITVRSSDGYTFPVDVRIEYQVTPQDAPLVVANFVNDGELLLVRLNSVVRSVFRNNAENVKALDYVNSRSQQEAQSLAMVRDQMADFGVTVTAVRIGDVGDDESLGEILKTQTDRELALQQQETFREQQRAAEQKKALTRTQQEAEEERRLATAEYQVRIAEQQKQQRIIAAQAEAEAIRVQADAQAAAFEAIARQIGRGNSALIEMLKIVGERGVQITPRVMVVGDGGANGASGETTALIGTMLDSMMRRDEAESAQRERDLASSDSAGAN